MMTSTTSKMLLKAYFARPKRPGTSGRSQRVLHVIRFLPAFGSTGVWSRVWGVGSRELLKHSPRLGLPCRKFRATIRPPRSHFVETAMLADERLPHGLRWFSDFGRLFLACRGVRERFCVRVLPRD